LGFSRAERNIVGYEVEEIAEGRSVEQIA